MQSGTYGDFGRSGLVVVIHWQTQRLVQRSHAARAGLIERRRHVAQLVNQLVDVLGRYPLGHLQRAQLGLRGSPLATVALYCGPALIPTASTAPK